MLNNVTTKTSLSPLQMGLGGLGIIGGIWMIVAPFVLNYGGATILDAKTKKPVPVDLTAVTVSDIVVGIVLLVLVGFTLATANNTALAKVRFYAGIGVIVAGVYLVAAPYLFDLLKVASYMGLDKPNTNDQLIGILTIIVGGYALQTTFFPEETGHATIAKAAPQV